MNRILAPLQRSLVLVWTVAALGATAAPAAAQIANGGFEGGDFRGWTADKNWQVANDSRAYYSGWSGRCWAWSGGTGEASVGNLRSRPFVMTRDGVHLLVSGWSSIHGTGKPRRWNYITLNLADGTEIDRVYSPDTTVFVPAFLDGSKHRGQSVYIEAVDDADQPTYSMLCIDDVRLADLPADYLRAAPSPPQFDPAKSIRLEDGRYVVEVSRANGSLTRIRDREASLDLILEPRLAGSFRFALVLPGREPWQTIEANWVFGRQQKLTSHRLEGSKLTLHWAGPLRNYLGARYDASVTETIELRDGGIEFALEIDNLTRYPVGEVYFPLLGGLQGVGRTVGQLKATQFVRPTAADACSTSDIFRIFNNSSPFGDQGPEQYFAYPSSQPSPWVGFCAPKLSRCVYLGAADPANRPLVFRLELVPSNSGTPREDGNWPRADELRGQPVGVELSVVDLAGKPGPCRYTAAPAVLRFVAGDANALLRVREPAAPPQGAPR